MEFPCYSDTAITIKEITYRSGQVIRMKSEDGVPWADTIILGFCPKTKQVKLSRPYAYVNGAGTTGPSILQGVETYTVPFDSLDRFMIYNPTYSPYRLTF